LQLIKSDRDLQQEALTFRDELRFVASFVGLVEPTFAPDHTLSVFQNTLNEIEAIIKLMSVDRAESSTAADGSSIVTISAGGTVLAVSKATLQQAPSGSILANMASDVWGHDLDSDGQM
jgi:hypothetical protein